MTPDGTYVFKLGSYYYFSNLVPFDVTCEITNLHNGNSNSFTLTPLWIDVNGYCVFRGNGPGIISSNGEYPPNFTYNTDYYLYYSMYDGIILQPNSIMNFNIKTREYQYIGVDGYSRWGGDQYWVFGMNISPDNDQYFPAIINGNSHRFLQRSICRKNIYKLERICL